MKKEYKIGLFVGLVLLVLGVFYGSNLFSIVTSDDFTVEVTAYTCSTCTNTYSKSTDFFDKSATFYMTVGDSHNPDDAIVYLVDGSGDEKVLWKQNFVAEECELDGTGLLDHPVARDSYFVDVTDDYVITIKKGFSEELVGFTSKSGGFGEPPYSLKFNVVKKRGTRCGVRGTTPYFGKFIIENLVLESFDPEVVCYQCSGESLITQSFEGSCPDTWFVDEPVCEVAVPDTVTCFYCDGESLKSMVVDGTVCTGAYFDEVRSCKIDVEPEPELVWYKRWWISFVDWVGGIFG